MTYQGDGSESGYVDPKRDCPHFEANFTIPLGGEVIDAQSRCHVCEEAEENWLCLKCYGVGCGRWKKAHGLAHYEQSGHCVAFSYADFTAWCYGCDSYVTNPILQLIQTRAYRSKFGKEAATKPSYGHSSPEEIEEHSEEPEVLKAKVKELAALMRSSSYTVAYTGAGVSTSASIPDYRGPKGVWTMADKGESVECPSLDKTTPTPAHMALIQLFRSGLVRFLTSTNLDGLHRRSGFSRENLAELHGNTYIEACPTCKTEYLRQKPVASGVDHTTLNKCENCGSRLVDNIINFGENLPEAELSKAIEHAEQSELSLVLGTSMRVSPANKLPLAPIKSEKGHLVIVNLQKTPFDHKAKLVIHARTDEVMSLLMEELKLPIPVYQRAEDTVLGK